jgi:hypothetical protein
MIEEQMKSDQVSYSKTDGILNISIEKCDKEIILTSLKEKPTKSDQVFYNKIDEHLNIGVEKEDQELTVTPIDNKSKYDNILEERSVKLGIAPYHVSDTKITKPLEERPSFRKFLIDKVKGTSGDCEKKSNNKGSKESLSKEGENGLN